jgi:hypothetical protein
MRSKSKEEILEGYLWALSKMRPTLKALFRGAAKARKDLDGLQFRPQRRPDLIQVMDWATTFERAREISAASIFLFLNQWVKALAKSLELSSMNDPLESTSVELH